MTRCLFYPCCGNRDLLTAMDGFAHLADTVHGADPARGVADGLRRQWHLDFQREIHHCFTPELASSRSDCVRKIDPLTGIAGEGTRRDYLASRLDSDVAAIPFIWHQYDAVEALNHIECIAVFFFRRDRPEDGEGSSGIRWLAAPLIQRVLRKLQPSGLFVTDGAGMQGDAVQDLLWKAPALSSPVGIEFEALGRVFLCESVFCTQRQPTLVWRVR